MYERGGKSGTFGTKGSANEVLAASAYDLQWLNSLIEHFGADTALFL